MTDHSEVPLASSGDLVPTIPGIGMASSFDTSSEDALEARYTNRWTRKQEGLVFEFTRDPALLHQYYRIYENEFKAVHNAKRYQHAVEDEHDRRSHFVIARRGNFCVGGARISIKTPRQPHLLPVEIGDFRLEDHFPELRHKQVRYGQAGRFCLLPEFRGGDVTREMQTHITRKAVALGLDVFFGTAPLLNARVYKQNCMAIGFKDVKIHFDIELPPYPMCEEVKFYLISGTLDKSLKTSVKSEPEYIKNEQSYLKEEV